MQKKIKKQKTVSFRKILLITFGLLAVILITVLLNFQIIENGKIIDNVNLILFLLTKNIYAKRILDKEPETIKVNFHIDIKKFQIIIEKIKEKPVSLICYKNQCYFLGEHSYIYPINNSAYNLLPIISPYPVSPDSYLLPQLTNALSYIFEFSNTKLLPLKEIQILSNFDLLIKTKEFYFLIDPNKDVKQQLNKLVFFLENYEGTDYSKIDLRIPNKIFFK